MSSQVEMELGSQLLNHCRASLMRDEGNCCNFKLSFEAIEPHSDLEDAYMIPWIAIAIKLSED